MNDSSETEYKIIQAAGAVFLEKGRDGSRMQEIAQRAGINKALLHYYFRSKEKLYQQVLKNELQRVFTSIFSSIQPGDDLKKLLKNFVFLYIDQIYKNPQLVRFIAWELHRGTQILENIFSELFHTNSINPLYTIIDKIKDAMAKKKIRKVDPHQLMMSIIGMCVYVFIAQPLLERIFPDVRIMDPEFIEQRKKHIWDILWNGLQPKTKGNG